MMVSIVRIYLVIYNWEQELFLRDSSFICFMIIGMIEFLRMKGAHVYVS